MTSDPRSPFQVGTPRDEGGSDARNDGNAARRRQRSTVRAQSAECGVWTGIFVRVAVQSTNRTELRVKLQPAPYPQPGGTAARRFFYSLLVQIRLPIRA